MISSRIRGLGRMQEIVEIALNLTWCLLVAAGLARANLNS